MALTKVTKELIQGGLGIDWQAAIKTGNFQSVASQGYFVNTTSNEVIVTMPPSPAIGDIVEIVDYAGTAQTNNIKITAQANINGSANDVKIDYQRGAVSIIYSGTAQGWLAEYAANDGTNALVDAPPGFITNYLVLAGGGAGGRATAGGIGAGGGGAGGFRSSLSPTGGGGSAETALQLILGTSYSVTVGSGGTGPTSGNTSGPNGNNSVFSTITSIGGGGGATNNTGGGFPAGGNGGSGGGTYQGTIGAGTNTTNGDTTNQGFDGGLSSSGSSGGGGGGAGGVGANSHYTTPTLGNGGLGLQNSITGSLVTYAGGGGGGQYGSEAGGPGSGGSSVGGDGGSGGGGAGGNGIISTGSGGGGSGDGGNAGSGSSGIVILRYATADVTSYSTTGTLNTAASNAYPIANTAFYPLNNNVLDLSGNGYNGTNNNVTFSTGKFGDAAVFNGSSSYIQSTSLGTYFAGNNTLSISFWFKSTTSVFQTLVSFSATSAASTEMAVVIRGDISNPPISIFNRNGGAYNIEANGPSSVIDGNWHNVVLTGDSGGNKLYLDGSELTLSYSNGSGSTTLAMPSGINSFNIGANVDSGGAENFTNGQIDQLRIFNTALSAANVTQLYNESKIIESTDGTDSILQFLGGTGTITFS